MSETERPRTIFAIETSCDETAAAVVKDGTIIVSKVVSSQVDLHTQHGGVVPELASRAHITNLPVVLREALAPLPHTWADVDAIACTAGPGLPGALLAGVNAAKALAWAQNKPLIAVNHLEGHIYANWLDVGDRGSGVREQEASEPSAFSLQPSAFQKPEFPLVCLIVSGGHTTLVLLRDHGEYQLLGQTRDDAAGEAFDKAARIMGLGYPGGPRIQKIAEGVLPQHVVPRAWLGDSYDFSFSGVKTHVLHKVQRAKVNPSDNLAETQPEFVQDLAAAFQQSVVDVLVTKTIAAAERHNARTVLLAGGVAANKALRETLQARSPIPVRYPPIWLCTDNAAMIGAAAYYRYERGLQHGWELAATPNLKF